jgi:hypothetical protein
MSTPDPVPPGAGMPAPVTAGAAPWWTSNDQWVKIKTGASVLAMAFPKAWIVTRFGLGDPVKLTAYANAAIALYPAYVLAVGFVKRSRSTLQPLVSSWRAAREHKATVALAQIQAEMASKGVDLALARQAQLQAAPAPSALVVPIIERMSPDLVSTLAAANAKATVDELARRQALARAERAHDAATAAAHPEVPLLHTAAPSIAQSPPEK